MRITAPGFRLRTTYAIAFSEDGELLATAGRDVALWSVPKRARLRSSRLLSHPSRIAFAPGGATLSVKNTAGEIAVLETRSADPVSRFVPDKRDEGPGPHYLHDELLLDGSWTGGIRVRPIDGLTPQTVWSAEQAMVVGIHRARGAERWAVAIAARAGHATDAPSADRVLLSKDPAAGIFVPLDRTWSLLRSVALSPDGRILAVRAGNQLERLDLATGVVERAVHAPAGGSGWAMEWSPDGKFLVVVEEGGFAIRDALTLAEVSWAPLEYPAAIAFAPGGRLIALGGWSSGLVQPWPQLVERAEPRTHEDRAARAP